MDLPPTAPTAGKCKTGLRATSLAICHTYAQSVCNVQGAYNAGEPGKPGNFREIVNSGKVGENSGNLKFIQGIYQMCA